MKNKYNAKKILYKGILFDSKKECYRYMELLGKEKKEIIKNLKCQVKFDLIIKNKYFREASYIADFVYEFEEETIVEDVKGYKKGAAYSLFKLKCKIMYDKYKIVVLET